MIPTLLIPLANHLWQSTLFAIFAGLLTLALRRHRAALRHWIWLAASMKFLIPFSLLVGLGHRLNWNAPVGAANPARLSIVIDQIGRPFTSSPSSGTLASSTPTGFDLLASQLPAVFLVVWLCGFCITAAVWFLRWRRIRGIRVKASPLNLGIGIPAMTTSERLEPGVFGVFKPVLLLPSGIFEKLASRQMNALLAHELCHVRRRDNMAMAVHSVVEAFFWFHPLVWWIENRMIAEQERACDEEVLRQGHSPEDYAEGILKVCEFHVASPPGVSCIGGSDLKKRIQAIMASRPMEELSGVFKMLLAASVLITVMLPVLVGVALAPSIQAQGNLPPGPKFEVVTIKLSKSGSDVVWGLCQGTDGGPYLLGRVRPASPGLGRCRITGLTLKMLVGMAYDYREPKTYSMDQQIAGGPDWVKSSRFDIEAKAENPATATGAQLGQMLQQLLSDRFKLKLHRDTKNVSGYRLVVAKAGPKLEKVTDPEAETSIGGHPVNGGMSFRAASLLMLTEFLSIGLRSTVQDKTGLMGKYDFTLQFAPSEHEAAFNGPESPVAPIEPGLSLVGALQEQLGLKLESAKVPMPVLVIDSAAKPRED